MGAIHESNCVCFDGLASPVSLSLTLPPIGWVFVVEFVQKSVFDIRHSMVCRLNVHGISSEADAKCWFLVWILPYFGVLFSQVCKWARLFVYFLVGFSMKNSTISSRTHICVHLIFALAQHFFCKSNFGRKNHISNENESILTQTILFKEKFTANKAKKT